MTTQINQLTSIIEFEIGKVYYYTGPNTGSRFYLDCICRTESTVTFLCEGEELTYSIEIKENIECAQVWVYHGHKGYVKASFGEVVNNDKYII